MATAKQNAINLYIEGIQNGNPRDAIAAYAGARYTQHSTGVADGPEGFIAFFESFLERNPVRDFKVLRALQDGRHVFLQVTQDLNNGATRWLTTDFFDTDETGQIIEHWDVIAPLQSPTASGRSQIDGPSEITDRDKTAINKSLVIDFINTVLIARNLDRAPEFISEQSFIRHDPSAEDGLDAFLAYYGAEACPLSYQECFLTVAEGNFVACLNRARWADQDLCQVDLFRVENGRIVEHWANTEPVPPRADWANSGKF